MRGWGRVGNRAGYPHLRHRAVDEVVRLFHPEFLRAAELDGGVRSQRPGPGSTQCPGGPRSTVRNRLLWRRGAASSSSRLGSLCPCMLKAWLLAYAIASVQKRLLQSSSPRVEYSHPFWLLTRRNEEGFASASHLEAAPPNQAGRAGLAA